MTTETAPAARDVLIPPGNIVTDLDVSDTGALLHALAERVAAAAGLGGDDAAWTIAGDLAVYASLESPSLLEGLVCFHASSRSVDGLVGCLATIKRRIWVDKDAGRFIEAAFIFIAPQADRTPLIKLGSSVERLAEDPSARAKFFALKDPAMLSAFVQEHLGGYHTDLCARDVMRSPYLFLTPDCPLREVVRQMLHYNLEGIGIVDAQHHIVGEITSDTLFRMGMPDFFSQLKSVAFLGDFDPFERYFEKEAGLAAGDVMSSDFAAVDEATPIVDIVFRLAVQKREKVYVVRHGELIGVIDRIRVLQKVLSS